MNSEFYPEDFSKKTQKRSVDTVLSVITISIEVTEFIINKYKPGMEAVLLPQFLELHKVMQRNKVEIMNTIKDEHIKTRYSPFELYLSASASALEEFLQHPDEPYLLQQFMESGKNLKDQTLNFLRGLLGDNGLQGDIMESAAKSLMVIIIIT